MPKASAIQINSTSHVDVNLLSAASMLEKAAAEKAQLVVLPEMFPLSGLELTDKLKIREPFGTGHLQDFLSAQARKNNIWIVGGTIPICTEDDSRVRAACLVFDNEGVCVARYDKIHLFDVTVDSHHVYNESRSVEPGDTVVVVDTPIGRLGLAVCYDIRFPELFRTMLLKGAEVFAIPAAFTPKTGEAHWQLLARARAVENFCYVIGACQTGKKDNGRGCYGHSLIVNPWGETIACLETKVGIVTAEIDLAFLQEIRRNMPIQDHCKLLKNKTGINAEQAR